MKDGVAQNWESIFLPKTCSRSLVLLFHKCSGERNLKKPNNADDADADKYCIAVLFFESDCMLSFWVSLQSSIGRSFSFNWNCSDDDDNDNDGNPCPDGLDIYLP